MVAVSVAFIEGPNEDDILIRQQWIRLNQHSESDVQASHFVFASEAVAEMLCFLVCEQRPFVHDLVKLVRQADFVIGDFQDVAVFQSQLECGTQSFVSFFIVDILVGNKRTHFLISKRKL